LLGQNFMDTELGIPAISLQIGLDVLPDRFPWYGIRTRSNHEKVAAMVLTSKGYEPYLPLYARSHRRAGALIESKHPLFPGYVFCRFDARRRLPILMTAGVISVLSFGKEPVAIPDEEIRAIQAVLRSGLAAEPCPYLREGQRVRVTYGSLVGVEGILVKKKSQFRMVVSVTMLQRSISVEIEADRLAAV
jgi:transcription termination/antitermination protein NusG